MTMRARAHDAHRRIVEDNDGLPRFTRASQNIATVVALLQGLLEPMTPEERQAQRKIHTLHERAVV
jgi:hypothetical protein